MKAIITIDALLYKRHFYLLKALKIKVLGMSSQNCEICCLATNLLEKGPFVITRDNEKKTI